ncbi:DJ-1/PfpI family protein [Solibacillus sp. FSL W8-0474]|uniref:DJ-1/PfpI family protein n=1 Tax=Solibacillus sp. FSL W8-0474 TaxID=2975336 RepID=UPI0030FAF714
MKKTAIILYPQFSEYELSVALSILMQGNKPIVTVGLDKQPIRGESGLTCVADTMISEINIEEIDSIVLPGCLDIEPLLDEEDLVEFLKQVVSTETIVASISSSPYFLAQAGLLTGKKYTVGLPMEAIEMLGVFEKENYCSDLVVQDGNMITARGSGFIRFGICLGKALNLEFDESWYQGT